MTRLLIAAYNYEAGGGVGPHDGFDMRPLQREFANLDEPPALVLLCEAKHYRYNGNEGLHLAAEALADELGVPYVGLLGSSGRGPIPPAIFYNPDVLTLRRWPNPGDPGIYDDKRNLAHFAIRDSGSVRDARTEFLAFVAHFNYRSGVLRRQEAELLDRYGRERLPVIGGGDLNGTASGDHMPQCDWSTANYLARSHKGKYLQDGTGDGTWVSDTAAVDHLIGRWNPKLQRRVDGCGFHAIAELAWRARPTMPLLPTVNHKPDEGGALLVDWLLVNDAMLPYVDPDTYQVHVRTDGHRYGSDHRLVTAVVDL